MMATIIGRLKVQQLCTKCLILSCKVFRRKKRILHHVNRKTYNNIIVIIQCVVHLYIVWIWRGSHNQGFWYSAEKKAKFRGIFRRKCAEKSGDFEGFSREKSKNSRKKTADFAGFSREKSKNSQKNWPILRDFSRKKSNYEGFSRANSKKNRPISREISGGNFAKKQSVKNSRFRWIFLGKFR